MGKVKSNQVVLLGRVGWKEFKYTENGTAIATINLGVKRGQDKWSNFFIKFFNTKMKTVAEEIAELVKEGEYIQITGRLVETNFVPKGWENQLDEKGNQKTVSKIEIIGQSYRKVYYNEETEEFDFMDGENG